MTVECQHAVAIGFEPGLEKRLPADDSDAPRQTEDVADGSAAGFCAGYVCDKQWNKRGRVAGSGEADLPGERWALEGLARFGRKGENNLGGIEGLDIGKADGGVSGGEDPIGETIGRRGESEAQIRQRNRGQEVNRHAS